MLRITFATVFSREWFHVTPSLCAAHPVDSHAKNTLKRRRQIVQTCYVMKTGFTFKKRHLKHSGFNDANISFMLLFFFKDIL